MQNNDPAESQLTRVALTLDRSSLATQFSGGMNVRYGRLIREQGLYTDALDLCSDPDPRIAFRASWALEWAYFDDPEAFLPHLPGFMELFLTTTNRSVQRSFTKMLLHMTERKSSTPSPAQTEAIQTVCFDRIIDPATPVAAQVFSLDLVSLLIPSRGWAADELREILLRLAAEGTPGQKSRSRKILQRLKKSKPATPNVP